VADAAVVARADASGTAELVGYVVMRPGAALDAVTMRRALAARLPAHMIPAKFVALEALPLTRNGKLDRAALPGVDTPEPARAPVLAPESAIERRLAEIWRGLLGVEQVGREDNFFDLGGHSLLAMRMLATVEAEFGERVRLGVLFRNPTVRGLADALTVVHELASDFAIQTLQSDGRAAPIIAINNFGIFHALARTLGTAQPFVSAYLADPDRSRPLHHASLEAIGREYISLIRQVRPSGPYILLGWCVSGYIAMEVAQQLRASGDDVPLVVMIDTWAPGYRKRLPWLRSFLAKWSYRIKWHVTEWRRGRRTWLKMLARSQKARSFRQWMNRGVASRKDIIDEDSRYDWFIEYLVDRVSHYQPKTYGGPVLVVRTSDEPSGAFLDPGLGWRDLLTGPLTVTEVPGNHLGIFQPPGVGLLADRILETLSGLDPGESVAKNQNGE
jgi:thioesterase domain-containing protein/acyl carrier protein